MAELVGRDLKTLWGEAVEEEEAEEVEAECTEEEEEPLGREGSEVEDFNRRPVSEREYRVGRKYMRERDKQGQTETRMLTNKVR